MTFESVLALSTAFLWAAPALLAPAALLLELERRWTRARRRAGRPAPLLAYGLDALAVVFALAAAAGTLLFAVGAVVSVVRWLAAQGARAGQALVSSPLLLAGAVLAGLLVLAVTALARGWVRLPQPKATPVRAAAPQPAVSQPAVSQPAVSQPAVSQPAVSQPAVSQPAVSQPAVSQPAVSQPAVSQPATPPAAAQPAVSQPVMLQPAVAPALAQAPQPAAAPVRLTPAAAPQLTRMVGAPPTQETATPARAAEPPRPAQEAAAPVYAAEPPRPATVTEPAWRPQGAAPAASLAAAGEQPALAMLDNRRASAAAAAQRPSEAVYRAQPWADAEEMPQLAMLNNRRRAMNERAAAQTAPAFSAPASLLPPPPPPARPWWQVPLATTLLLVVLVGGGVALYAEQLKASFADLGVDVGVFPAALPSDDLPTELIVAEAAPEAPAPPEPTAAPQGTAVVNADSLNVRSSPGANQPVVATLVRGDQVVLLGETTSIRTSTWVKVRIGEVEGWVNGSYLQ